jgi:hypothetical protein
LPVACGAEKIRHAAAVGCSKVMLVFMKPI